MKWFKLLEKNLELSIFVKPNAKKTAIVDMDEKYLHIAIHAKPMEGDANRELVNFLAKYFNIPKTQMTLHRGEHSRYKMVMISLNTLNASRYKKLQLLLQEMECMLFN